LSGPLANQLAELKAKYDAKAREADQLREKLTESLGSSSSAANDSVMAAKLRSLENKVASEARMREMTEKRLEATKQELEDMKTRRAAARKRVQQNASSSVTAAKARKAVNAANAADARRGGRDVAARASKRATRIQSKRVQSKRGPAMTDVISKILGEMKRVEASVKKAEEEREAAQNELLEAAIGKQAAEDSFNELSEVVTDIAFKANALQILIATKCGDAPDVKASLSKFHAELDTIVARATKLIKNAPAANNAAVAQIAIQVGAPPPPPPPASPLLQAMGGGAASRFGGAATSSLAVPSGGGARASTLLTQIRRGATLKQIDISAIKKERDDHKREHRKSVSLLNSLQQTLSGALSKRNDSMNPDSSDGEDDDDWGDY
jgi:hypothetical protein